MGPCNFKKVPRKNRSFSSHDFLDTLLFLLQERATCPFWKNKNKNLLERRLCVLVKNLSESLQRQEGQVATEKQTTDNSPLTLQKESVDSAAVDPAGAGPDRQFTPQPRGELQSPLCSSFSNPGLRGPGELGVRGRRTSAGPPRGPQSEGLPDFIGCRLL